MITLLFAGPITIGSVQITDTIPTGNRIVIVQVNVSTNSAREEHSYFVTIIPFVESGPTSFTTENSTFLSLCSIIKCTQLMWWQTTV